MSIIKKMGGGGGVKFAMATLHYLSLNCDEIYKLNIYKPQK